MRTLFAALLLVAPACGDDSTTTPPTGTADVHVAHYDYALDLATRAAHAKVTVVLDTAGDCVKLPYRGPAFDAATVRYDGAPAASVQLDGAAMTACGEGHEAGAMLDIEVDLTIAQQTLSTSQVGFSTTTDADHNPFTYLVSWVNGCDQFGPCDARPSQFATYTFHVTHTADLAVKCSGAITEVSPTQTQCDFTHAGGPTYSTFGLAAYPAAAWVPHDQGMWGSAHVTVYDRATTGITAAIDSNYHEGFVAWMESTFGPYPFGPDLRVLTAPTYWSGFEHPGNIVLDDILAHAQSSYLHPVAHVLDHEMAHQWAGDQTTIASTYDFVWKESMAEYLAFVYEDMADAPAALKTSQTWKNDSFFAAFYPVPGEHPALFDYYGDVYGPGPMVLFRQLEVLTSRQQVIAALQSVLGEQRALSVDELLAALADKTGLDLTAYANAWIKGTGTPPWPVIGLSYAAGSLHAFQTNPMGLGCKFHVALLGAPAGMANALVEVDMFHGGADQTIAVADPGYTVTGTQLDPLHECLVFPVPGSVQREVPVMRPWVSPRASRP